MSPVEVVFGKALFVPGEYFTASHDLSNDNSLATLRQITKIDTSQSYSIPANKGIERFKRIGKPLRKSIKEMEKKTVLRGTCNYDTNDDGTLARKWKNRISVNNH